MSDTIFATAAERKEQLNLPYAGALLPNEAHALMTAGDVVLVDVRTAAEWQWVGRVPDALMIEWQSFPTMEVNTEFVSQLQQQVSKDKPLAFLCRSGARSHFAATIAAENGYTAFNVLEGFEGDLDAEQHRNTQNGWRARQLPWLQS